MGTVVLNAKTCKPVMAFTYITKRWLCVLMVATASAHVASAAGFQPTWDKTGNAVGGTVTGRHWHQQRFASRVQGWQDCLYKYMSSGKDTAGQPPDPCFFDTGAGTALSLLSGRALQQASNAVPNYAASASSSPTGSGSSSQDPSAASTVSPASLGPATTGPSSPTTSANAASANQDPYAGGTSTASTSTGSSPIAAGSSSATTTSNGAIRDGSTKAAAAEPVPVKPQPIGPDPARWQQTQDFPEGTRLTHDQAVLLLSGKGFHPHS